MIQIFQVDNSIQKAVYAVGGSSVQRDSIIANHTTDPIKNTIDTLSNMTTSQIFEFATDKAMNFGMKILAAILVYLIGGWIIRRIKNLVKRVFEKRNTDPSLASFLLSFISITLTVILIICTINALGVDTTSFIAILGGAGLAIGMAMSGTLQNLAGGVMILLFKPFKVGDYIQAQGYEGYVKSIEIASTHITTFNNEKIILPNGTLFNGVIKNSTQTGKLRCEWNISISYGDDIDIARDELIRILNEEEAILKKDAPQMPHVVLTQMGESCITLTAKAWILNKDFWKTKYKINERIYKELPLKGIRFPFPQVDVHIKQD